MIVVKNLTKSFGQHTVFKDLNLKINTGEIIGIVGPSGSGKSTFLRCLNLLEIPDSGQVYIGNQRFNADKKIPKKKIIQVRQESTMVFQQFNLFRQKTAWQNVAEGLIVVKHQSKQAAKKLAYQELDQVGLLNYANFYPGQLSGGQKQRVAIARSLATNSKILLLDEPTSALDPELVGEVLDTLRRVVRKHPDYTVVLISHELGFIKQVADQVILFENGKILEQGKPKAFFNYPKNKRTKEFLARFNQTT